MSETISIKPMNDEQLWGCDSIEEFKPPPEVIEQVLDDPEIAIEYPEVYEQAIKLSRKAGE